MVARIPMSVREGHVTVKEMHFPNVDSLPLKGGPTETRCQGFSASTTRYTTHGKETKR